MNQKSSLMKTPQYVPWSMTSDTFGSRNKASIAIEALLDGEAEALTRTCIDKALGGDMTALKLCMDRICAPRKDSPISFEVPQMESAADAVQVMAAVMTAVAGGNITPSEAHTLAGLIDTFRRTLETSDIEKRVTELEAVRR
jgi:hypothetical protein